MRTKIFLLVGLYLLLMPFTLGAFVVGELEYSAYSSNGVDGAEVIARKELVNGRYNNIYPTVLEGDLVIPAEVTYEGKTYAVTGIRSSVFADCTKLKSVSIPSTVVIIESGAFSNCTQLEKVYMLCANATIGENTFYNCTNLKGVYINDLAAWFSLKFKNGNYGPAYSNPMYYAHDLYVNGKLLTGELVVPDGVRSIGQYALYGCHNIEGLTIGSGVTSIADMAFADCSDLQYVNWKAARVNTNPNSGVRLFGTNNSIKQVTFGDEVEIIPHSACCGLSALESVKMGKNVRSIGYYAFEFCTSLRSVNLPRTIENILANAFNGCTGLEAIHIEDLKWWCELDFQAMRVNPLTLAHHLYLNEEEILDLTIPDGVTTIKQNAFQGASALKSLTVPEGVTEIQGHAFEDCSGLATVNLPVTIKRISGSAFNGCSGIKDFNCYFPDPTIVEVKQDVYTVDVFDKVPTTCTLNIPIGSINKFRSTEPWRYFLNISESLEQPGLPLELSPMVAQVPVGQTLELSASPVTDVASWQSDDTKVATVTAAGVVKAVGPGAAYVTVRDKYGKTASCLVLATGDMNGDGQVNIGDVNFLLDQILQQEK